MRKYVLLSVVISTVIICFPSKILAINSGAHIYVTEQVFGSDDIDLLYGSIAPDISLYVPNPVMWPTGFDDTHYDYISLHPQGWTEPWKRFLIGWEIHNEVWGADWYSHIEYQGENGYVVEKATLLAPFIPVGNLELAEMIAHYAIEFAIDILIQEFRDPDLGQKLSDIATYRSDEDVRRLFNILVAKNKVTDKGTLYQSEAIFRELITNYSQALSESSLDDIMPLALLGSVLAPELFGVDLSVGDVEDLLWAAIFLCISDYHIFINHTIDGIKTKLGINQ